MSETTTESARSRLGHGLALRATSTDSMGLDLHWRESPNGFALTLVEGVDNLAQDLIVALLTPTGTDAFDLGFGFDGLRVLTLSTPGALTEELIRLAIIRTLSADTRVAEVNDVRLVPTGLDRRHRVEVDIRTVLDENVQLALTEVEIA